VSGDSRLCGRQVAHSPEQSHTNPDANAAADPSVADRQCFWLGCRSHRRRVSSHPRWAEYGTTTNANGNGEYRFDILGVGNANVSATATGFQERIAGTYINGTNTLNFSLRPPTFTRSATEDTVFDMPTYVSRIKIQGRYRGYNSNFIVHIASRSVVNELIGTGWGPSTFEGTYVTNGGVVEILSSSGVAWTFTEVQ
jgi:hypothetical protein